MKTLMSLLLISFLAPKAMASAYITCGTSVNVDEFTVRNVELNISSEDEDFNGPVGGTWHMDLGDGTGGVNQIPSTNAIVATTTGAEGEAKIVEIVIQQNPGGSQPVSTKYKIIDLYSETPVLEKYERGGIGLPVKVGTYQCLSSFS